MALLKMITPPPILLTSSAIAMDPSVILKDQDMRIFYTLESLEKWLVIYPQGKFVLCDGSNFNFSPLIKLRFPTASIECLYFENDQNLIKLHGKGYGEGEIIRYALKHSVLLSESTYLQNVPLNFG